MQFGFGSGSAWGIDSGANPTPGRYDILQEGSVDFSFSNKPMTGEYQLPVTVGRGSGKISGKMKWGRLQGRAINSIFFGGTKAGGQVSVSKDEAGAIPSTPYQVTVANSGTWVDDLGVRDATTLVPYVRVASAPATGQYSVAAGVYTFAAADTTKNVLISYTYTIAGSGEKITIANQLIGAAPNFKNVLTQVYNSQRQTIVLNACVASKLSGGTKTEDFFAPEMDYDAMADASNNIGTWSFAETS
jgi:hypothetical protein